MIRGSFPFEGTRTPWCELWSLRKVTAPMIVFVLGLRLGWRGGHPCQLIQPIETLLCPSDDRQERTYSSLPFPVAPRGVLVLGGSTGKVLGLNGFCDRSGQRRQSSRQGLPD